jgi:hypothetical protein
MKHAHLLIRVMLPLVCAIVMVPMAQAQYRASLRGTVTDPQGAVISGAKVTLLNPSTNSTLVSVSDANGIYQFHALPPAPYRLTVEAPGFQQKVLENVRIVPDQPNGLDVQLAVGRTEQSVTVSGTTEALPTESATLSATISNVQVQHLPSFGRDIFQLIHLAPGMTGDGAQAGGGGGQNLPGTQGPGATGGSTGIFQTENGPQALAIGQQYENNSYSIDGINTTSSVWGGTTVITPSEDSIENVTVLSNNYDAEHGRFSGAQVQVISKGGTNDYHGSLFWVAHRPGLAAYQRYNGPGNPVLRDNSFFNQIGGSIGGPIWKNKIFAFFSIETVRSPQAQKNISSGWYETSAFASSASAGPIAAQYLGFPGSAPLSVGMNASTCANIGLVEGVNCATIPGQGLDIGSPLTSGVGTQDLGWTNPFNPGVGNGLDGIADIANYTTETSSSYSKYSYNGRVDANVTNNDRLGFAIYWVPQSATFLNGPARAYNLFHHSQVNDAFSLIWDHTFSPSMLNEFRVNAAGWRWNEITSNPQQPIGLPSDSIGNIGSASISQFGPNQGSILNQWTYGFKDVATKVLGRHTIKFGGDLTRLFYLQDAMWATVPQYNFYNLWDFLNDAPNSEWAGFDPHTGVPTSFRQDQRENIWGLFVQDNFKLRRNLTVTAGLRWSYFGPLYVKQHNLLVAIPGTGSNYLTDLVVAHKDGAWNAQKDNFGPQIGFAWSPGKFKDKLVVRGGYGLSYNQEEIAISANVTWNPGLVVFPYFGSSDPANINPNIVYGVSSDIHSFTGYPSNPNTIVSFGANGLPTTGQVTVSIIPPNLPTMRVHHYSLEAQYDLGHDFLASLSYQGSLSRNNYSHANPNAGPAANGWPLNPQIGGGDYWGVSGWGNYNAMIAEVKHQFSHGLSADAQFTWAKSMDTASGPYYELPYVYNLNLDYGRSDYDIGKALKLYAVWQPVLFHGENKWLEKVAGGWTITGIFNLHSGFPWTPVVSVIGGNLYCGTCWGYDTLYPASYLGGAGDSTSNDAFKTGSNYPSGGTAYFSTPTYTTYSGNSYGSANPQSPGVRRNSLNGPGYKDLDLSLAKAFGLPKLPGLGEDAKFEFRLDAFNVFNNLNFDATSISNNIGATNFGVATRALGGRVVTLGLRFSF